MHFLIDDLVALDEVFVHMLLNYAVGQYTNIIVSNNESTHRSSKNRYHSAYSLLQK